MNDRLDPTLALPDFVPQLGLVLFVYSVGVAGGPAFFSSLGRAALRTGAVVLAGLLVAAAVTVSLGRALGLGGPTIAGLYAGSLTNTPALASVVEALRARASPRRATTRSTSARSPTTVTRSPRASTVRSETTSTAPSRSWRPV